MGRVLCCQRTNGAKMMFVRRQQSARPNYFFLYYFAFSFIVIASNLFRHYERSEAIYDITFKK